MGLREKAGDERGSKGGRARRPKPKTRAGKRNKTQSNDDEVEGRFSFTVLFFLFLCSLVLVRILFKKNKKSQSVFCMCRCVGGSAFEKRQGAFDTTPPLTYSLKEKRRTGVACCRSQYPSPFSSPATTFHLTASARSRSSLHSSPSPTRTPRPQWPPQPKSPVFTRVPSPLQLKRKARSRPMRSKSNQHYTKQWAGAGLGGTAAACSQRRPPPFPSFPPPHTQQQ